MNESEIRRKQLLEYTKKQYDDRYIVPAIHPRYQSTFPSVYSQTDISENRGSLRFRIFMSVLLFVGYHVIPQMENAQIVEKIMTNVLEIV